MQIRLHKRRLRQDLGHRRATHSGIFPPETAFSTRMIPALVAEGSSGRSWTTSTSIGPRQNYPHTDASNLYPPNRADQINPDPAATGGAWVQLNNLWAPSKVSAPFGYQPHYVQYVDPDTGAGRPDGGRARPPATRATRTAAAATARCCTSR